MNNESINGFVCRRCGQCCREPGYVHLSESEVDQIAEHLGLSVLSFTERYTRLTTHRSGLSLVEKEDGSCVFLEQDGSCLIQSVKPGQCEQFPHGWRFDDMKTICKGWKNDESR